MDKCEECGAKTLEEVDDYVYACGECGHEQDVDISYSDYFGSGYLGEGEWL